MADEFYQTLGVAKDADTNEIKRAFRTIARECHPDVAGDDPEKAERFKRSREAYEVLVDPELRAKYDRPKNKVVRPAGGHGSFFDAMWKRTSRDPQPGTGFAEDTVSVKGRPNVAGSHAGGGQPSDSRANGTGNAVDMDDLFAGGFGTRERAAGRMKMGKRANVDIGEDPTQGATWNRKDGSRSAFGGAGMGTDDPYAPKRGDDLALEVDVPASVGRNGGTVSTLYERMHRNPRWVPGGTDPEVEPIEDVLDVRIIRGTGDGEILQERGKGNAGTNYGPYGDLYVTVRLVADPPREPAPEPAAEPTPHPAAPRPRPPPPPTVAPTVAPSVAPAAAREAGLVVLDVSVAEAILGGRAEVDTPGGRVRVSIPPGTSSGTRLRLAGRGAGGADLLVETRIVVPKDLDPESRALIEAFAARNPIS